MWFGIKAPNGDIVYPYKNDGTEGYWRWGKEHPVMREILNNPIYAEWVMCPYDEGVSVNGQKERWVPYEKIRTETKEFGWNCWLDNKGTNAEGTAAIKAIFGSKVFDTPKPLNLIQWIVSLMADKKGIVLDSFAGSACTAHSVLNLNKKDGGHRRFICIEMMKYADTITAERVKRVIKGYKADADKKVSVYDKELKAKDLKKGEDFFKEAEQAQTDAKVSGEWDSVSAPKLVDNHLQVIATKKATKEIVGTGGDFSFYELGNQILTDDGVFDASLSVEEIKAFIWQSETHTRYQPLPDGEDGCLGIFNGTAIYAFYDQDQAQYFDLSALRSMKHKAESYVVYAGACLFPEEDLDRKNITFKKIPRDVANK